MKTNPAFRNIAVTVICYAYALLFVYAAVSKLLDFENFRVQLAQSPLLSAFAAIVAWAVPVAELLIVSLLVIPKFRLAGLYLSFLLMVSFTAYIYIILNYSSFIPCSCGGILEKMTWQEHLIFNLIFVLLAVVAIVIESKKTLGLQKSFRPLVQLPVLALLGIGTVTILFIWSENIVRYHNTFIRRFPRTPAVKVQQKDLGYDSYYFAGIEDSKVYLGNSEAQLYVTEFDTTLQSRVQHRITLDRTDLPFSAVKIKTAAPYFFVTDGSIPCVFRGAIKDWRARLVKKGGGYFSLIQPIDSAGLGVRFQKAGSGESVLGQIEVGTDSYDLNNPGLLQKQSDGLFDTDGYLMFSKRLNRLVYLYAYRNSFIVFDQSLAEDYTGHTIDTISRQSFDVVTIKSNGQTNAQEAIDKINASEKFEEKQKEKGIRIIKKLFSSKSRKQSSDEAAESRVDYISDHLGIVKEEVINIINLLREEKILADAKDLTAFVKKGENKNRSLGIVETFGKIENFLLPLFEEEEKTFHLKELNEDAELYGCGDVNPSKIKTVINFWSIKNWIKRQNLEYSKNHFAALSLHHKDLLKEKLEKRHELAKFIIEFLYERSISAKSEHEDKDEALVEFSVHELKAAYEACQSLFKIDVSIDDIEDTLFYLSRIEALKIEGGFLVVYNRLTIERLEHDNFKRYTKDDYKKLNQFYENKVQQIHIVGEYAKKMIDDYKDALQFVEDYFQLNFSSFLKKYFPGSKVDDLKLKMTPGKFKQLFGELSPTQLKIINDNETKYIAVAAGPGSGKTRVLVHKLASLLLMEDVKHEQLLMVTFSRAAATEFKKRLLKLIGNAAHYIEIKTFHSYCFDLLGKVGSLEKSGSILKKTIEKIRNGDVEANRITKTVLVIDEAQDMDQDEFDLINALMEQNEEMRVIAVGDDDQNIYEFRGASAKYLEEFIKVNGAVKHELVENYRSKSNLVSFSNQFVTQIAHRLKQTPIIAKQADHGTIKIVRYQSGHLAVPVVDSILNSELIGTTCVLTKTNDEALQVTGLLLKKGMAAKLIQTNDGFSLYNLLEIRSFLAKLNMSDDVFIIAEELWQNAKRELQHAFQGSSKLEICNNIIKEFEATFPKRKYKSDLEVFIGESKLEDFFNENGETIFVSTIHKAKGKEFDNVFLMLEDINPSSDEVKRQLYVAITRAKQNLSIHLNSNFLDNITAENLERIQDNAIHLPPNEIAMHLTYKDVWLDYFINKQDLIALLRSGDSLILNGHECLDRNGQPVLKFSKFFVGEIERMKERGYGLKSVSVNFVVYWLKEGVENEILVVLPEVWFLNRNKTCL